MKIGHVLCRKMWAGGKWLSPLPPPDSDPTNFRMKSNFVQFFKLPSYNMDFCLTAHNAHIPTHPHRHIDVNIVEILSIFLVCLVLVLLKFIFSFFHAAFLRFYCHSAWVHTFWSTHTHTCTHIHTLTHTRTHTNKAQFCCEDESRTLSSS